MEDPKEPAEKKYGLPAKITREHVIAAIEKNKKTGWDKENDSIKYDLVFEDKRYPPKIVFKEAYEIAFGKILDVADFSGGEDTTNKYFRDLLFEIDIKPRSSTALIIGEVYSRDDLRKLFIISAASINNGVFKPKGFSSVWLFATEKKTPDRTQYNDYFDGQSLQFEGQTKRMTDHWIIDHENDGNEVIVFYRETKDKHPHGGFTYLGPFSYHSHVSDDLVPGPTHFVLYPINFIEEDDEKEIPGGVAEKRQKYGPISEGKERTRIQTYYERDNRLRIQAIRIHGDACAVCGFHFGKKYGSFGEGYIEIHHVIPLSAVKSEREIDPQKDLVPVCSNCHRMIHRFRERWLTIDELKKMVIRLRG